MSDASNSGRFKPGQSGNPGGKRPIPPEIKEALARATPVAVERLISLLDSADEKIVLAAAKEVLDRHLGKAVQVMEHGGAADGLPGLVVQFVRPGKSKEGE